MSNLNSKQVEYLSECVVSILEGKKVESKSPFDCSNPLSQHGNDLMSSCQKYIETHYMEEMGDVDLLFSQLSEVRARGYFGSPKAIDFDEGDRVKVGNAEGIVNEVHTNAGLVEVVWDNPHRLPEFITPNQITLLKANESVIPIAIHVADPSKIEDVEYTLKITGHDATNAGVDKVVFGVRASNPKKAIERGKEIVKELGIAIKGMIDTVPMNTNLRMMMNRSAPDRIRWQKLHAAIKQRIEEKGAVKEGIYLDFAEGKEPKFFEDVSDAGMMIGLSLSLINTAPNSVDIHQTEGNKTVLTKNKITIASLYRQNESGEHLPLSEGQVVRINESLVDMLGELDGLSGLAYGFASDLKKLYNSKAKDDEESHQHNTRKQELKKKIRHKIEEIQLLVKKINPFGDDFKESIQECETAEDHKNKIFKVLQLNCTGTLKDMEEMSSIIGELTPYQGDMIGKSRREFFDRHGREPEVFGLRRLTANLNEQVANMTTGTQGNTSVQFSKQAKLPIQRPIRTHLQKTTSSSGSNATSANLSTVANFTKGLQTLTMKARQVKANPGSESSNRLLGNVLSNLYYILVGNTNEPWNPLNTSAKLKMESLLNREEKFLMENTGEKKVLKEEEVFMSLVGVEKFNDAEQVQLEQRYPGGDWINGVFGIRAGEGMVAVEKVKDGYFCHAERWGEGEFFDTLDEAMNEIEGIAKRHNLKLNEISMPKVRRFPMKFVRSHTAARGAKENPSDEKVIDDLIEKARTLKIRMGRLTSNPQNASVSSQISLLIADLIDFLRQNSGQPWNPLSTE